MSAPTMQQLLTSTQVCQFAGVTFRQITHWTDSGYVDDPSRVTPDGKTPANGRGSGTRRRWTQAEAWTLLRIRLLVDTGMRPPDAAELVHEHQAEPENPDAQVIAYATDTIRAMRVLLAGGDPS